MAASSKPDAGSSDTETGTIVLRPMTAADLPLMCRWLGAPHVNRWWHDSAEPAAVSAAYLPCIEGVEPSNALIAELPAGPVAFVQWYRWADYPDYGGQMDAQPDEAGFDYLIGEEARCGQGLGTRLIAALMRLIRDQDPTVGGFLVDPEQANAASRRVLEKNGLHLVAVKQLDNPDGHPVGPSAIYRCRVTATEQAGGPAFERPTEPDSEPDSERLTEPAGSVGDLGSP